MKTFRSICWTALPLLLSVPYVAQAQDMLAPASTPVPAPPTPPATPAPTSTDAPAEVAFSADQLVYEEASATVTASGTVRMNREGYNLRADSVTWNRRPARSTPMATSACSARAATSLMRIRSSSKTR